MSPDTRLSFIPPSFGDVLMAEAVQTGVISGRVPGLRDSLKSWKLKLAVLTGALGLFSLACSRPPEGTISDVTTSEGGSELVPTPPIPSPTPQIKSMPWAELSLGRLVEGERNDLGFKGIGSDLWIKNKTPQWQWLDFLSPGYPHHSIIDSGEAEQRATIEFSSTYGIYEKKRSDNKAGQDGIYIPPKAAVRFHVRAQIPTMRQAKTLKVAFPQDPPLALPFTEGNVPTGLFDNMADFPPTSSDNTLVCVRDRSITVKFRDVATHLNTPYAYFDLLIHNSSGSTITPRDYASIREAWSARGIFQQTDNYQFDTQLSGPPIPPDLDGTGSMGVQLAADFDIKNKRLVPTFPQLLRITIYPNPQRQANQPPCDKKEMLFLVDAPSK